MSAVVYSVFHLDKQVLEVSQQADVTVAQTVSLRCFRHSSVTGGGVNFSIRQALFVARELWLKRRKLTVCATVTGQLSFFNLTYSSETRCNSATVAPQPPASGGASE